MASAAGSFSPPVAQRASSTREKVLNGAYGYKLGELVKHTGRDPCSNSNFDEARVNHIAIRWDVDFDKKILHGAVGLSVEVLADGTSHLVLDTKTLKVQRVTWNQSGGASQRQKLNYELGGGLENTSVFGTALRIELPASHRSAGSKLFVQVSYATTPESSALQWLAPAQTADKTCHYLLSQCQAIHARSLLPCPDTPASKLTYNAEVTVKDSRYTVLMSALSRGRKSYMGIANTFLFEQPVPIAPYLIAIAIGHLKSRDIGPRSKVWAEPSVVDAAAKEFERTEQFIAAGEQVLGKYVWERYDILCLPPSFPYGGMENPCLTFVTPTLLAGDGSLANVIIHEITHSWTGNLVTNRTWEDFWLNEGCTMFVQRKIMEKLDGFQVAEMDMIGGVKGLSDTINKFGPSNPLTELCPKLDGVDPDDAFSRVPYEKGFNFLYYLQSLAPSVAEFEAFFKSYIERFAFQSITTADFTNMYKAAFPAAAKKVNWDAWLHSPGMPPVANKFDDTLVVRSHALADAWLSNGIVGRDEFDGFTTAQRLAFLDRLLVHAEGLVARTPRAFINPHVLNQMDHMYKLTETKNAEIRFRWQWLCLQSGLERITDAVVEFLKEQGRNKFVRPLFRELMRTSFGRPVALELFEQHRDQYHPISVHLIGQDLEAEGKKAIVVPKERVCGPVKTGAESKMGTGGILAMGKPPKTLIAAMASASARSSASSGGAGAGAGSASGASSAAGCTAMIATSEVRDVPPTKASSGSSSALKWAAVAGVGLAIAVGVTVYLRRK